jgi:predicted phage tail protein
MTIATNPAHRSIASLNLPLKVPALITYAQNIVKGMTGNPAFPSPTPTLAQVGAAITALNTAETATLTRVKGSVATRNTARVTLHTLLQQLKGHVQNAADADPENAASIIQSAGMAVRKSPVRPPRVFGATPGPVAGSVKLVAAAAARRAAYEWEYSTDGGKTWVTAPPTLQAKTTVTGLPSGTAVLFRARAVTKTGAQDWSAAVSQSVR